MIAIPPVGGGIVVLDGRVSSAWHTSCFCSAAQADPPGAAAHRPIAQEGRPPSGPEAMDLELDQSIDLSPRQGLKVSPRLVAANYILELSSQELQQAIATELSDNPALELIDTPTCRICGTELQG